MKTRGLFTLLGVILPLIFFLTVRSTFFPSFFSSQGMSVGKLILLLDHPNEKNRGEMIQSLQTMGSIAVPSLIQALQTRDNRPKRILREISRRYPRLPIHAVNPARTRALAATGLGALGPVASASAPNLIEAMADRDPYVVLCAQEALLQIGNRSVPQLAQALSHFHPQIRERAASVLARFGIMAHEAVPHLVQALEDPSALVRSTSAEALGRIATNPDQTAPALALKLLDPSDTVREKAAEALNSFGAKAHPALPQLVLALEDILPSVRVHAANTLSKIGSPASNAVTRLAVALSHPTPMVRISSARALGRIGPPAVSAIPQLIAALQDQDREVRGPSARALGKIGELPDQSIPALTLAVRDEYIVTRIHAVDALGEFGTQAKSAVPELLEALYNDQSGLGRHIKASLTKITPDRFYDFDIE